MLNMGRVGSREVLNLQIFDFKTATPLMHFDYANTASDEKAAERSFATGGSGGTRRIKFDGAKTQTLTVETQIFTMQHLALLSGNPITSGEKSIYKTEVVKVGAGNTVTLKRNPLSIESISVLPFVNGIAIGEIQEVEDVEDNVVTLGADASVVAGDEVEVYYQFTSPSTHSVKYTTKGFPGYLKLVGDTQYPDEITGELVSAQKVYYKTSLQPNYTVTHNATGDPATLTLVFDVFGVMVNGEEVMGEETIYEDDLV